MRFNNDLLQKSIAAYLTLMGVAFISSSSTKSYAISETINEQMVEGMLVDFDAPHLTLEIVDSQSGPLPTPELRKFLAFDSADILVNDKSMPVSELASMPEGSAIQCVVQLVGEVGVVTRVLAKVRDAAECVACEKESSDERSRARGGASATASAGGGGSGSSQLQVAAGDIPASSQGDDSTVAEASVDMQMPQMAQPRIDGQVPDDFASSSQLPIGIFGGEESDDSENNSGIRQMLSDNLNSKGPDSPQDGSGQDNTVPEHLLRGPVHEGFARPHVDRLMSLKAPRQPPAKVREIVPEGLDDFEFVDGYWFFDDTQDEFLWVTGVLRRSPQGMTWKAGRWIQSKTGFERLPGFWQMTGKIQSLADRGEGKILVPARKVKTLAGTVIEASHVDEVLERRGVLFAPVRFAKKQLEESLVLRLEDCEPLATGNMLMHMFVDKAQDQFHFGDFYGKITEAGSRVPWHQVDRVPSSLLSQYERIHRRLGMNFSERLENWAQMFEDRPGLRPPMTCVGALQLANRAADKALAGTALLSRRAVMQAQRIHSIVGRTSEELDEKGQQLQGLGDSIAGEAEECLDELTAEEMAQIEALAREQLAGLEGKGQMLGAKLGRTLNGVGGKLEGLGLGDGLKGLGPSQVGVGLGLDSGLGLSLGDTSVGLGTGGGLGVGGAAGGIGGELGGGIGGAVGGIGGAIGGGVGGGLGGLPIGLE